MNLRRAAIASAPFATAFAVRVAAGLALPVGARGARGFDFFGYMADNLLTGRGLGWYFYTGLGWKLANRGPLYPLQLAAVRWAAGGAHHVAEVLVQAVLGAVAIVVPALLARRWAGERAWLPALWISALWPYSVITDTGMVEHVLYAPLCVLSVHLWLRCADAQEARGDRVALYAGVAAGLATLARLTFFLGLPFLALSGLRRTGIVRVVLVALGTAAVLAPWVVRNHQATGHWVLGSDGGRALYVGNAAASFEHYPERSIDDGERAIASALIADGTLDRLQALNHDEVLQDAAWRDLALAEIRRDPPRIAWNAVRKAGALWSPVYNPGPAGALKLLVFAATFVPLVGAAAAAFVTCPRLRADLPLVLGLLGSFTLVSMVFWGQSRYLAPLHGVGIAAACAWLVRRPEPAA